MNTSCAFTNTLDLVDGLFVTINSTNKLFDYADAYEMLPDIMQVFYDIIGQEPYELTPKTKSPSKSDLDFLFIMSNLLSVCSIGQNQTGDKVHLHLWIYNLHSFNIEYSIFRKKVLSGLKKLKNISKRNEFGIKLVPSYDRIDAMIRQSNYNNQAIVNYINNRNYDTLMNYFSTKNNENFIYFY